jgi:NADPH-dependent 2,4-dienoyl-CoA reductase/sulfur reductase-like enzyme
MDDTAPILLICGEPHLPYDRPPLSKNFLLAEQTADDISLETAAFYKDAHIDLNLGRRVESLDLETHVAETDDGGQVRFDKVLIATGGRPVHLPVAGASHPAVHYLRTMADAMAIRKAAQPGRSVVVVGAGLIGLELATTLTRKGVHTTVLDVADRVWPRLAPPELATFLQGYCEERGVAFRLGRPVSEVRAGQDGLTVLTGDGAGLSCDLVCVGIGIRPNVELAERADLLVDDGIFVDSRMQTFHPDVFAAGDVARYTDPVLGGLRRTEHWGHAEYSGQLAGANMTGAKMEYDLLNYAWSDVFDLHIEMAGDQGDYDRVLMRGGIGDDPFIVLYLKEDRLRGYLAVNAEASQFPPLQKLIRKGADISGHDDALKDPRTSLSALASS